MRIVKIQGGLGNQLFGFALAHSIARLTDSDVAIDVGGFRKDQYRRLFELTSLATQFDFKIVRSPILNSRIGSIISLLPFSPVIAEASPPPADRVDLEKMIMKGRYFSGYWQNERYFIAPAEIKKAIREFIEEKNQSGQKEKFDVVIHYRSYNEEIYESRRATPTAAYFIRASDELHKLGPLTDVLVVSDNPAQAKQIFRGHFPNARFSENAGQFADFRALMSAKRLILTNSSFSWWAGFCSDAAVIVYPTRENLFHYPMPAGRFLCR